MVGLHREETSGRRAVRARLLAIVLGMTLLGVPMAGPLSGSTAVAGVAQPIAPVSAVMADLAGDNLDTMNALRTTYGWGTAFSWPASNPCPSSGGINWGGVGCDPDAVTGVTEVISLILGCGTRRLTGFPPILSRLQDLREVTVRGCWTTDTPIVVETDPAVAFPELSTLRFDINALTGDLDEVLPTRPPMLSYLNLSSTYLGGSLPAWIVTAGSDMTAQLSRMRLSGDLPDVDFGGAPRELRVRIDLTGNVLTGVLPDYVLNSPNSAATLKVDYNMFDVVNTPVTNFDMVRPGWRSTQTVPPTDVTVTPGAAGAASVSWTPIAYQANGGYYEVLTSATPGGPYTSRGTTEASGGKTASSLEIAGLPGGTNHVVVRTFTPGDGCLAPTCSGGTWNHNDLTSVNSAEVSAIILGPPVATVSAPADFGSYTRDAVVPTSFSCGDPNGPGIASCVDSNGESDGTGVLDTSTAGPHTYTVTATSSSTLTHVASISYTVYHPCPTGWWSSTGDERNDDCTPAAAGHYATGPGATAETECPKGSYQDRAGQNACTPAAIGSYVDTEGATSATDCPDGQTTAGSGSDSIADCFSPDTDPPVITIAVDAADTEAASGWYNAATSGTTGVRLLISVTDATGVETLSCDPTGGQSTLEQRDSASWLLDLRDGTHAISCSVSDGTNTGAGSGSTAMPVEIKVDQTAPTLSASATTNGDPYAAGTWSRLPVDVTFSCSDATSGVASRTADTTRSSDGADQSAAGSCTDHAGNQSQTTFTNIDIDRTAPGLAPTVSPDPVVRNGIATATPNASDALSGLASSSCATPGTGIAGQQSVTCSATDNAGNQATALATYVVATPCARGTFSATGDDRAGACAQAPIGFYVATRGATAPTACPPATITAASGATTRDACRDARGSALKTTVLRDLGLRIAASTRSRDLALLSAARDAVLRSLTPAWWTGTETLSPVHGTQVFDAEREAATALLSLVVDSAAQTRAATLRALVGSLVEADRQLVLRARLLAITGDIARQAAALAAYNHGDRLRTSDPVGAINAYRLAWYHAILARR